MRAGKVTAAGIDAAGVTRSDLARRMVGRPVIEMLDRAPVEPGRVVLAVERRLRRSTTAACRRCGASRSRSAPARSSASPPSPATASPSSPRSSPACGRARAGSPSTATRSATGRPSVRHPARASSHVPGGPDRRRQRAEPLDHRQPHHEALPDRADLAWLVHGRGRRPHEGRASCAAPTRSPRRPSISPARILSGGNLQRLILAREIDAAPTLLVAVQPTRGLDVGAIEGVHHAAPRPARARARRRSSSPRSSTSSSRSPIGSRSCTRAGSPARSSTASAGRSTEIGLLMTGGDEPTRSAGRRRGAAETDADDPARAPERRPAVAVAAR